MDWQQKLHALKAITSTHLEMREPDDWYVRAHARSIEDGTMLRGAYGDGATPQAAVESDWAQMTALGVVVVLKDNRRVRWNGFMWEDVQP